MENIKSYTVDLSKYSEEVDKLKDSVKGADKATDDFDNTLADLQKKLKQLKATQLKVDIDSSQFQEYNEQIAAVETKIKQVKSTGKDAFNSLAQDEAQARLEANQYSNSMDGLKQKLKDLNSIKGKIDIDSSKFKEVSKQILEVNNKLKDVEASQGVFSRNVGNYANSFIAAYGNMGKSAKNLTTQIQGVTTATKGVGSALKTLATNPFLAALALALTAILATVNAIKKAIGGNEETTRKWEQATAKLQPLFDAISNVVEGIGSFLVDNIVPVIEKIADWVNKLTLKFYDLAEAIGRTFNIESLQKWAKESKKAYEDNITRQNILIKQEHQLADLKRKNITEIAKLEAKAAELREKASDTETYNAKERRKFLDEAHQVEQQTLQLKRQEILLELQIAETRAEATANSKEDNDALAEKKKLLIEIDRQISENNTSYNKEIKKNIQEQKREFEEQKRRVIESVEADKKIIEGRKNLYNENTKEYYELLKEELKKETEAEKKKVELSKFSQDRKNQLILNLDNQLKKRLIELDAEYANISTQQIIDAYQKAIDISSKVGDDGLVNFEQEKNEKELDQIIKVFQSYVNSVQEGNDKINLSFKETDEILDILAQTYGSTITDIGAGFENKLPIEISEFIDKLRESGKYSEEWLLKFETILNDLKLKFGVTVDDIANKLVKLNEETKRLNEIVDAKNTRDMLQPIVEQIRAIDDAVKETNGDIYDKNKQLAELQVNLAETTFNRINELGRLSTETEEEFNQRRYDSYVDLVNAKEQYEQAAFEERKQRLIEQDPYLNPDQEDGAQLHYDEELTNLHQHLLEMQAELETMQQKQYESTEQFEKRKQRLQKQYNKLALKEEKLTWSKRLSTINKALGSMSSIFGSIADLYAADAQADADASEEKKKAAEESFNTMKAWQRAGAIVDMLSGALGITMAYLKEDSFQPAWIRPVLAAAQYAATIMSGMATIRQINATTFDSTGAEGGGGSSTVEANPVSFSNVATNPLLDENVDMMSQPNIRTDNDEESQDNRVYILQSDIEDSSKQVRIRQSTTTF